MALKIPWILESTCASSRQHSLCLRSPSTCLLQSSPAAAPFSLASWDRFATKVHFGCSVRQQPACSPTGAICLRLPGPQEARRQKLAAKAEFAQLQDPGSLREKSRSYQHSMESDFRQWPLVPWPVWRMAPHVESDTPWSVALAASISLKSNCWKAVHPHPKWQGMIFVRFGE